MKNAPVHAAADNGNLEILEMLINSNYDYWSVNSKGKTPLDLAKEKGHTAAVSFLESKLNCPDMRLCSAILKGDDDAVSACIKLSDLNINKRTVNGKTPLGYAASVGNASIVSILLTHPEIDVNLG